MPNLELSVGYLQLVSELSRANSSGRSGGCGLDPRWVGNILSWRFDHEIFSTVILSLPLIQECQLSVSGKRM